MGFILDLKSGNFRNGKRSENDYDIATYDYHPDTVIELTGDIPQLEFHQREYFESQSAHLTA
jgi:hypothetical protein